MKHTDNTDALDRRQAATRMFLADCDRHLPQGVSLISFDRSESPASGTRFCTFCRACLDSSTLVDFCRQSVRAAAYEASLIGEPCFFRCWLGLNSFAIPVWSGKRMAGAAVFGGFVYAENADEDLEFVRDGLPAACRERLLRLLPQVQRLTAAELRGHARFVEEALLAHGLHDGTVPRLRRESYLQQRRIAELMHQQSAAPAGSSSEPDAVTGLSPVLQAILAGRREEAMLRLDEYLCHRMLAHASAPHRLRASLMLLSTALEQQRLQHLPANAVGELSFMAAASVRLQTAWRELEQAEELDEICFWAAHQVDAALERQQNDLGQTGTAPLRRVPLARRVDGWLEQHFAGKATLAAVSRALGASVPSLVTALRRDGGGTFHERLTRRRVQQARQLLAATTQPLHAVAHACGFADQSHLSRIFQTQVNLTPGEFRRLLDLHEQQMEGLSGVLPHNYTALG